MAENSIVSVIIPTKDRIDLLKITLNSVFCQSYKHIEIVVIDDGSKDATEQFCNSLSNIKYIKNSTELSGPSRARNIGLQVAQGHYVLFLDDDDLIHPLHIEQLIEEVEKLDECYIASSRWRLFEINDQEPTFGEERKFDGKKSFSDSISAMINPAISDNIQTSTFFWRRSQLEDLEWNEELFTNGDLDFFSQALMKGYRFYGVDLGYVYYRSHNKTRVAGIRSLVGLESSTRHRFLWSEKLKIYRDNPKIRTAFCNSFMSLIINWLEMGVEGKILQIREMMREWGCSSCFLPIQPKHPVKAILAKSVLKIAGFHGLKFLIQYMKKNKSRSGLTITDIYHAQIIKSLNEYSPDRHTY